MPEHPSGEALIRACGGWHPNAGPQATAVSVTWPAGPAGDSRATNLNGAIMVFNIVIFSIWAFVMLLAFGPGLIHGTKP